MYYFLGHFSYLFRIHIVRRIDKMIRKIHNTTRKRFCFWHIVKDSILEKWIKLRLRNIIFSHMRYRKIHILESTQFKKGSCHNSILMKKIFCFQSNLEQTRSDFSTHEFFNLTKFGEDWTENKKRFFSIQNFFCRTPS